MKRHGFPFASALIGLTCAVPATAAPNVFWTFGIESPAAGSHHNGFAAVSTAAQVARLGDAKAAPPKANVELIQIASHDPVRSKPSIMAMPAGEP